MNLINIISFGAYILVLLAILCFFVYSFFSIKKNKPQNKSIWIFPFWIFTVIALIIYRCSLELSVNIIFQEISFIFVVIGIILFFLSTFIAIIIGYVQKPEKRSFLKRLIPIFILGLLLIFIGTIFLITK